MPRHWTYRTTLYDAAAPSRPVKLSINADLVARAREEGLDLPSIAAKAIAAELARHDRALFDATMERECRAHEEYLAEYGSLADAIREESEAQGLDAAE